ncbi:MAG TPA: type II secretion system major pseudopilin GspG [Kiritimatiellia bacterium]|nr:type II secretion system major pseudopilin GspG [Kiritimatiellia bacterium]HMO98794.1 type II secretion system major pseudopilin GspG [Kiritimatiellia bacterium]HMP96873.1 type II secretion system major pseudopilin GspG [Kiritimatiellia bacterium]
MNTNCHRFVVPHSRGHVLRGGFTLIEVLVVLAIISILAGIVTLNIVNRPSEAKVAAAKTQLRALKSGVNMYRTDNGMPPTLAQGLAALITKPTLPPIPPNYPVEGYLDTRVLPKDPWKNDFIYLVPGRRGEAFEIISYGSDGQPGGEGDAADLSSSDL